MGVWSALAQGIPKRGSAVLVGVRVALGSTPREAGAGMVVFADGSFSGTIGGGTLEWRAIAEAQRLLNGQGARIAVPADMTPGSDAIVSFYSERSYALGPELGQCCGGRVVLSFDVFAADHLAKIGDLARREAQGVLRLAATRRDETACRRIIAPGDSAGDAAEIETYGTDARLLLLFGAGHVGRALVLALAPLPFAVRWIDPRADAFPAAVPATVTMVRPADPVAEIAAAPAGAFVLIMTHSHALDLALCDAALAAGHFPYVGVIGSATKRARFVRQLESAGHAPEVVAALVCPIGATGPKSKLPAAIAAGTCVELLVADEAVRAGQIGVRSVRCAAEAVAGDARAEGGTG